MIAKKQKRPTRAARQRPAASVTIAVRARDATAHAAVNADGLQRASWMHCTDTSFCSSCSSSFLQRTARHGAKRRGAQRNSTTRNPRQRLSCINMHTSTAHTHTQHAPPTPHTKPRRGRVAVERIICAQMHGFYLASMDDTPITDYESWKFEVFVPQTGLTALIEGLP